MPVPMSATVDAGLDLHRRDNLLGLLVLVAIGVVQGLGDACRGLPWSCNPCWRWRRLGDQRGHSAKTESMRTILHNDFSIGMASGGSIKKFNSAMRAMAARMDCSVVGLHGDHEGQVAPVGLRQLQNSVDGNVFGGQRGGQLGDDAGAVLHAEAQIVGGPVQRHGDGQIFAQPRVGERRNALRAAGTDLARDAHQVADHGDAGGMRARAAAVVERIGAIFAAHPDGVVRAAHAGQNGRLRNQRRTHGKNQAVGRLARGADQADGVMQLVRVLEIDGRDAADAFGVDVLGDDPLAECERGENGEFRARVEAVDVGGGIGFGVAGLLRFARGLRRKRRRGSRSRSGCSCRCR